MTRILAVTPYESGIYATLDGVTHYSPLTPATDNLGEVLGMALDFTPDAITLTEVPGRDYPEYRLDLDADGLDWLNIPAVCDLVESWEVRESARVA